jgi:hypothetical protein
VTGENNVYMVRSEDENVLEILKTGAGKGWKGSVGPIV